MPQEAAGRLDRALDALLAVRVALGGVLSTPALPEEALDAALAQHEGYRAARGTFSAAVGRLLSADDGYRRDEVLAVESAANAMVGQAAEVAWRLGVTAGGTTR